MQPQTDPPQQALFELAGPDANGCVWMIGTNAAEPWRHKLGPEEAVAEVMLRWLGAVHVLAEPAA